VIPGFKGRFYSELKNLLRIWRMFVTAFRNKLLCLGRQILIGPGHPPIVFWEYSTAHLLNNCLRFKGGLVAGRKYTAVQNFGFANNRLVPW
jgi:hypothetical protein